MIEVLISALLLLGAFLMLLASIGLVRLPDLPTRMHATTKSGALGTSVIMVAVGFTFMEPVVWARVAAVIAFIIVTAPVAAHVIGRAGYFVGVPLWEGSVKDDLKDHYDPESHTLSCSLPEYSDEPSDKPVKGDEQ